MLLRAHGERTRHDSLHSESARCVLWRAPIRRVAARRQDKPEKEVMSEIQAIIRQITASVSPESMCDAHAGS